MRRHRAIIHARTLAFVLIVAGCPGRDAPSFARRFAKLECKRQEKCWDGSTYTSFYTMYGGDVERCRREVEEEQLAQVERGCTYRPDEGRECLRAVGERHERCHADRDLAIAAACAEVFDCPLECDLTQDSCGPASKCIPYSEDGGEWDRTKCVSASTGLPGEPCEIAGVETAGYHDTCGPASLCWAEAPGALTGICVGFCEGIEPGCTEAGEACLLLGELGLPLCLPTCTPSQPSTCAAAENCVPASEAGAFVCAPAELPE
ncbi:hypothetical protein [Nannocystis exedens]|uniref:hypothetical protein n=1 Tax=Nannocystis exedens TaxID=54 RepID=UPI000BBA0C0E|nr:hypothetical protein [Nannocystis exedens]